MSWLYPCQIISPLGATTGVDLASIQRNLQSRGGASSHTKSHVPAGIEWLWSPLECAGAIALKSPRTATNNAPPGTLLVKVFGAFSLTIDCKQVVTKKGTMTSTKRTLTEAQRRGLQRAQEARKEMRLSPTAKNRENVLNALSWTHAHAQTTRGILLDACRVSKADFLQRLAEDGYMRKEKVLGRTFWLLNKSGVDLLRSMLPANSALAALPGTRHVNLHAFAHNAHAQRVIAAKLRAGGDGCRWWSERQLRALVDTTEPGAKVPDGAFRSASGLMTYIEVERSRKAQPELEAMLLNIARLLEKKPGSVCELHIEPGISERYISTLKGWLKAGTFRAWSESTEGELFQSGRRLSFHLASA